MRKVQNSEGKEAMVRSFISLLYSSKLGDIEGHFTLIKQNFMVFPVVIYTTKNFYLNDIFNEELQLLTQSGLIDFWRLQEFDMNVLMVKQPNYPKTIKVEHIMGSLQILLIGYGIGLLAFVVELGRFRLTI